MAIDPLERHKLVARRVLSLALSQRLRVASRLSQFQSSGSFRESKPRHFDFDSMKSKEYRIIGSEPVDDEELVNLCDRKNLRKSHYLSYVALLLLALSLAANVTFFIHRPVPNAHVSTPTRSTFGKSVGSLKKIT